MASLNKIQLIGNLGRNPETNDFGANKKKVGFSLATSESYQTPDGQNVTQTEWHNIVLWSPLAEIAEKYLAKGRQVYIEGKLRSRSYEDNTGVTRKITEVIGRRMILLGNRNDNPNTANTSEVPTNAVPKPNNNEKNKLPF